MKTLKFQLIEHPICPACGKDLDHPSLVAKDYVVCGFNGIPNGNSSCERCCNCNTNIKATPTDDLKSITFSTLT